MINFNEFKDIVINTRCTRRFKPNIRQYLPKKSEFLKVSKDEINMIQNRLNHRPRKILNYKTPYEIFFSEMSRKLAS